MKLKKTAPVVSTIPAPPAEAILLTVSEAAALLRLSVSAIRSWILHRRIPFIKLGKSVRIRRSDIDALIAASTVKSEAA